MRLRWLFAISDLTLLGAAARAGDLETDGVHFQGNLFLAGAGGVAEYLADSSPGRRFRPGIELPRAPVTALSVGVLADSSGRELLIATDGEGLVRFDGSRLRQMWPDDPAARKITALLPTAAAAAVWNRIGGRFGVRRAESAGVPSISHASARYGSCR